MDRSPAILVGVMALGMIQIVTLYENTAPSLKDLRQSGANDTTHAEALMDADIVVGGATLVVIIAACWATRSSMPLFLIGGGLLFVAFWHHIVLNTPNTLQRS